MYANPAALAENEVGCMIAAAQERGVVVDIGCMPIAVRSESPEFLEVLWSRYGGFVNPSAEAVFDLVVEVVAPEEQASAADSDDDLNVSVVDGRWILERGDFRAELDPGLRRGSIHQTASPYAIDAALRILYSLLLATQGGLLLHAASAVRNGRAFMFAGVSGAGKTTISRLAPADVTLLTDEISYLRRKGDGYVAHGTPFAGELSKAGENVCAPLAAIYLLAHGPENRIDPVTDADAARALLECVLFFAKDAGLVTQVFDSACELAKRVAVQRLTFVPDSSVWEMIR